MFEAGLTYERADFHLHTRKDKEFSFAGEDNSFVKEYVSALKNANIGVGVITNHNEFPYHIIKEDSKSNPEDGKTYPYEKGIAQALIVPVPAVTIEELTYEELQNITSERGTGKLGSSNK